MDDLSEILKKTPEDQELAEFLQKKCETVVSDWSYAAGTSNQAKMSSTTILLVRLLEACHSPQLQPFGSKLIGHIIKDHLRVIYRCLFVARSRITAPALNLLKAICNFPLGTTAADLYNSFDFSLKIIPKLLSDAELRKPFLEFYLAFIEKTPSAVRKDLISQRKIVSGWFSRIDSDPEELILETLHVLKECVVRDRSFTKSSKIGLFNDWILKHLAKTLTRTDVGSSVSDFLYYVFTDSEHGIGFSDRGCYGEPNNKSAFSFLRMLKPWENQVQMVLTVNLMKSFSELVAPYFAALQSTFSFAPKVSMFWFSFAVLHARVISLPLSDFDSLHAPDPELVGANILPPTLTKSTLTSCLTFSESSLVRFQAAQIVLYSLRKLQAASKIFASRVWDILPVFNNVMERLPEVHLFLKPIDKPLVQTTYLSCLREYCLLVTPTTVLPSGLTSVLDKEDVHGLELINAHNVLEVQAVMTGQAKWWNRAGDSLSFFTKLVRFASSNPDLSPQCTKLLHLLVEPTLAFQSETFVSPIDTLLYSLEVVLPRFDTKEKQKLWSLIDESISRSVRAPYPYIDRFVANVSPFAVALIEQWQHVDKNSAHTNILTWLHSFIRDLGIIGEDSAAIGQLATELGTFTLDLPFDDYFEFVISAPEDVVKSRDDIIFKINTPLEFMATVHRIASSPALANFLISNLPNDLLPYLTSPSCFRLLLTPDLCEQYLATLRANKLTSSDLVTFLEQSPFWPTALDFLSDAFLIEEFRKTQSADAVDVLTGRGVPLPLELALQYPEFSENLKLQHLSESQAKELLSFLISAENSTDSICAVIEASGYYDPSLPLEPSILLAASRFASRLIPESEIPAFIGIALKELRSQPDVILKLMVMWKDHLKPHHIEHLEKYSEDLKNSLNEDLAKLASSLSESGTQTWLKRCILHLTRVFAKAKTSQSVRPFVFAFSDYLARRKTSIWKAVNANSLNALITTILAAELSEDLILLTCRLVFSVPTDLSQSIHHTDHLQTLLELPPPKDQNEYSLLCTLIWRLVMAKPSANSTSQIQDGLLRFYNGSSKSSSQLLLQALSEIESQQSSSWVDKVTSWELRGEELVDDYEIPPLVTNAGNTLQVTIEKAKIVSSCQNYDPLSKMQIVPVGLGFDEVKAILSTHDIEHPSFGYHDEFLINALASCDYIIKEETLDVRVLTESGSLAFILCCLASQNKDVVYTATQLLRAVSTTLAEAEKVYREQVAAQVLVNKVLMFLHSKGSVPGHLAVLTAEILNVVTKPGHFLHEMASNWLLAGPSIKEYDLPLFKEIQGSTSDTKPREMLWLVDAYRCAMIDRSVVNIYIKSGLMEWLLTQMAQLTPKSLPLKRSIKQLIAKAEELGGSMNLIGRHAALVWPEPEAKLVNSVPKDKLLNWLNILN